MFPEDAEDGEGADPCGGLDRERKILEDERGVDVDIGRRKPGTAFRAVPGALRGGGDHGSGSEPAEIVEGKAVCGIDFGEPDDVGPLYHFRKNFQKKVAGREKR